MNANTVGAPLTGTGATDVGQGTASTKLDEATVQEALFGSTTPPVVTYLIAALFNAASHKNDLPTEVSIRQIFNEWNTKGTYEVTGGIHWDVSKIIEYLSATQNA